MNLTKDKDLRIWKNLHFFIQVMIQFEIEYFKLSKALIASEVLISTVLLK